jgi:hypothetical protein
MKTRNGFVSNSSSSSFIVAIGKVVDKEKALSFLESCGVVKYDYTIDKLSYMISQKRPFIAVLNNEDIIIECFEGSSVELDRSLLKEDDEVLAIYISNEEGDVGRFSGIDENGEYWGINYNIDLDYFSDKQIELYNGLNEENGIIHVDKKFGAGRNG